MLMHTVFKKPIAFIFVYLGVLIRLTGNQNYGVKLILKGRRVDRINRGTQIISNLAKQSGKSKSSYDDLTFCDTGKHIVDYAGRTLIFKIPLLEDDKIVEKGVIIFKFTETFVPIYKNLNVSLLSKYFRIILEPSWVGYSVPEILSWTALNNEKVIVQSPYKDDYELLSAINTNLVPISIGPADWVDTSKFFKIHDENSSYDVIYVANFDPIKRVDRYLRALVNISRIQPDYKAALVLAGHGSAKREVLATLDCAKKKTKLDVFYNLTQEELNKLFNRSKVNVLLSLREGANKGLAEGLFSGVPALLIEESAGGNYLHVNDRTGRIVPDIEIEKTLLWFKNHYNVFEPNEWAVSHISPSVTTQILSDKLKEIELMEGRNWKSELYPKVNRPELAYLNPEDEWLLSWRGKLLESFSKGANDETIKQFLAKLRKFQASIKSQ